MRIIRDDYLEWPLPGENEILHRVAVQFSGSGTMKRAQWGVIQCILARAACTQERSCGRTGWGDLDWRGQLLQQYQGQLLFIIIEIIKYGRRIFIGAFSEISALSMGLRSESARWHSSLSSSRGFQVHCTWAMFVQQFVATWGDCPKSFRTILTGADLFFER